MTAAVVTLLLAGALQQAGTPAVAPVTMQCADGGTTEITDRVRIACNGLNVTIAATAVRNITLVSSPRFVIPLFVNPATAVGAPVGHKLNRVDLSVVGRDEIEYPVHLQLRDQDVVAGLLALTRLTGLEVFTERTEPRLSAADVPQRVGHYVPVRSADRQARAGQVRAIGVAPTPAGEVIILYGDGHSMLWNPTAMTLRPLAPALTGSEQACRKGHRVIGVHLRGAAIFSCGRVVVYDLDSPAVLLEVPVDAPGAAALADDGTLYWLEGGQLRYRSSTTPDAKTRGATLPNPCSALVLGLRGRLLFCQAGWEHVYVHRLERGTVEPGVRIPGLKPVFSQRDPLAVDPAGNQIAAVDDRGFYGVRSRVRFWTLHPAPKVVRELLMPKKVFVTEGDLRYSTDGSTLVATGRDFASIDVATGSILCTTTAGWKMAAAAPDAQGVGAAVVTPDYRSGELPRVVLWDARTCQIRTELNPELGLLQAQEDGER